MPDDKTTFEEIKQIIRSFVAERDWDKYHSPKNLSMSIAIEAAELMEHFQWSDTEESKKIAADTEKFLEVQAELSDIIVYALGMANVLGIDISEAMKDKIRKNAEKYPARIVRGSSRKYTEYRKKGKS
ncbi:MAG: nucleotide pyrophosphohydrolase [Candidatus Wallbacteria bacterium]|nr:nucleotide pyrophosphohydrolase [Candidatus Wallbacteria bacterium]